MLLTAKLSLPNEATEPDLTEITSVSFSLLILTVLLGGLQFKKEICQNGTRHEIYLLYDAIDEYLIGVTLILVPRFYVFLVLNFVFHF